MNGRYEFKYALPLSCRSDLVELVLPHIKADKHGEKIKGNVSGYTVHSLYFDTPKLSDYFDRLSEKRVRNRMRIRTYGKPGDDRPVFLENKRKKFDRVIKHRVRICSANQWHACSTKQDRWRTWKKDITGNGIYAYQDFDQLVAEGRRMPVSVVHYEREVYVGKSETQRVRFTIDRNVRATVTPKTPNLFAPADVELIPADWMVVEMKFDADRPKWMRNICRQLNLRAVPVSKFALSVMRGFRHHADNEVRYFTPRPLRSRSMPPSTVASSNQPAMMSAH